MSSVNSFIGELAAQTRRAVPLVSIGYPQRGVSRPSVWRRSVSRPPYNPVRCPLMTMIIMAIYHTGFTKKTMWNGLEYVFYCYNNFEFLVWLNYINQLVLLNNQLGCSAVISLLYRSSCLLSTQLLDFYQNRHEHVR